MLYVYINYPTGRISVHQDPDCNRIQVMNKADQRVIHIERSNAESLLGKFEDKEIKFGSNSQHNDAWLQIELGNVILEENLVKNIQDILGRNYAPLSRAKIKMHCLIEITPNSFQSIPQSSRTGVLHNPRSKLPFPT